MERRWRELGGRSRSRKPSGVPQHVTLTPQRFVLLNFKIRWYFLISLLFPLLSFFHTWCITSQQAVDCNAFDRASVGMWGASTGTEPLSFLFLSLPCFWPLLAEFFLMLVFLFSSLLFCSIVALLCVLNQPGYSTRITKDRCSHGNSYLGGLVPISHS